MGITDVAMRRHGTWLVGALMLLVPYAAHSAEKGFVAELEQWRPATEQEQRASQDALLALGFERDPRVAYSYCLVMERVALREAKRVLAFSDADMCRADDGSPDLGTQWIARTRYGNTVVRIWLADETSKATRDETLVDVAVNTRLRLVNGPPAPEPAAPGQKPASQPATPAPAAPTPAPAPLPEGTTPDGK